VGAHTDFSDNHAFMGYFLRVDECVGVHDHHNPARVLVMLALPFSLAYGTNQEDEDEDEHDDDGLVGVLFHATQQDMAACMPHSHKKMHSYHSGDLVQLKQKQMRTIFL